MIAAVACLLVSACTTGPIPVSGSRVNDSGAYPTSASDKKLPGAPAVQNATP